MDLVENVGSGLKRIRDTVMVYDLDTPVLEADEHRFTVSFKRKTEGKSLEKCLEKGTENQG